MAEEVARSLEPLDSEADPRPDLPAAAEWCSDLLSAQERLLLGRLAVFAGSWTPAALEMVCSGAGIEAQQVPDLLAALIHKGLAVRDTQTASDAVRYRLLEAVRQPAWEQLSAGMAVTVRDRHLRWCMALAAEAQPRLAGPELAVWLARLDDEHDNLRAALEWTQVCGADEDALRLGAALWPFWQLRGYIEEGRDWLEALIGEGSPDSKVPALYGSDVTAPAQQPRGVPPDQQDLAASLLDLGSLATDQGHYARATTHYDEALALYRARGDAQGSAEALSNLGDVAYAQGDFARAVAVYGEALAQYRALDDATGIAAMLNNLGTLLFYQGDLARAAPLLREALEVARAIDARAELALALESLAQLASATAQALRGAQLGGAAEALREAVGAALDAAGYAGHTRALRALRRELGQEAVAAAWAQGRALPLHAAIALALEEPSPQGT